MLKNKEKLPLLCWRFPPIKKNISPLFFQKKLYFFSIWEGNFRIRGASRLPFYALTMHHSPALGRGLVRPLAGARYTPPWAGRLALAPLPRRWRLVRLPARWGSLIARLGRRPCAAPLSRPAGLVRCGVFWRAPAFFLFNFGLRQMLPSQHPALAPLGSAGAYLVSLAFRRAPLWVVLFYCLPPPSLRSYATHQTASLQVASATFGAAFISCFFAPHLL